MFSITSLKCFAVAAEELNFTRAAKRLYITQQALSNHIAKLEEYGVERCCYGHLHGPTHRRAIEGKVGTVDYSLVSADYLGFVPKKILD